MSYEAGHLEDIPPMVVDLFDMEVKTIGANDTEFLSRATLRVSDIGEYAEDDKVPTPTWFPLYFSQGGAMSGEILMSFAIVDDDHTFDHNKKDVDLPKEAGIVMQEYKVTMNILGLRNLQSAGMMPVKKANILFNLKSMVGPDVGNAIENMKTEPGAPGPDPTLNTLIEFSIDLPTDVLYCPRMSCTVYNNVMFGWN
jgi:hypothetical protein